MKPEVIETSWSASESIFISLEQAMSGEDLTRLTKRRINLSRYYRPYKLVIDTDVLRISELVMGKLNDLKIRVTCTNIGEIRQVMLDELKDSIIVRDHPMEALTCPLQEVGIPSRVINPLIRDWMSHLFHLVPETERTIRYRKWMGENRTKELRECLLACGLDLLWWPNGPDFLSRDLNFIDFHKKNHPRGRSIIV